MQINWLWDTRIKHAAAIKILKDANHPKFNIYARKLFSRVSDPAVAFDIIDEKTFCKIWPRIKKHMKKDQWLNNRILFWQTIYERVYERLKEQGIKIREPEARTLSPVRTALAHNIKNIRAALGYTQKDVAKKLGVIQQYVSRIESGRENVTVDTLKRFADIFNKRLVVELQ